MGVPYDVHEVEARWRARWEQGRVYAVDVDAAARPFFNLVEFPYPSAEGLHIGHIFRYSGADAYGRLQRMRGHDVFQPIGFDAFGIHSENYALRVGQHPADLTGRTTEAFRAQLSRGGMAWDWGHAVDTSRPNYYRWTQWIFTRLFRAGLAYQAEAPVVWCPGCMTVLAREQVEGDGCERCGTPVTERVMRQWFLRTTAYTDRLRAGLDDLDWPERAKRLQRHWLDGMHDWLISRQRYWGPPIPIVHCDPCGPVAVPDEQLPVELPHVDDVRPTGTGVSPLAGVEEFVATTCPECGASARRETDVSDTFLDSAWYFLRYPSTDIADAPWDPDRTARWLPVDFYSGGPEHVQRHHMYARFLTMALHDLGLVPFAEPFTRLRLGGMIVKDGAKMSKSRGNVVGPDPYWDANGSDVLRCALLFTTPWEQDGRFRDDTITGIERFFGRVWRAVCEPTEGGQADAVGEAMRRVEQAIDTFRFNVGLSAVMELVTAFRKHGSSAADRRTMVLLLAPFAPHLAEELWSRLGGEFSVHRQPWPAAGREPLVECVPWESA
jgi:leucyl-tRNA synthetase